MKRTALLFIILSFSALGQNAQYELRGSFPHPITKGPANFTMRWSETNGRIQGQYDDNASKGTVKVIGAKGDNSRIFRMAMPKNNTLGAMTIITGEDTAGQTGTKIPVSIVTQDQKGVPLTSNTTSATIVAMGPVQRQQEEGCQEGFGAVAGFCGVYEGMISENVDKSRKCTLNDGMNPSLQLDPEGNFILHAGPVSELVDSPIHRIGRLQTKPGSARVDVLSRECRPLAGIGFAGDNCKRINLIGRFTENNTRKRFVGTYSIVDEKTNASCSYQLTLAQRTE
ncbi:MAG TPA: hypothetical protein VNJ01_01020 [Bacteriovoracaceae bacterium]|nr:hypothetical protein [Bacteriovoracaceae bacterium]